MHFADIQWLLAIILSLVYAQGLLYDLMILGQLACLSPVVSQLRHGGYVPQFDEGLPFVLQLEHRGHLVGDVGGLVLRDALGQVVGTGLDEASLAQAPPQLLGIGLA